MSTNPRDDGARRLIPGAYDRTTLTYRQPGSMGGAAFGSADMPIGPSSMDAATVAERELEGGGGMRERPRHHRGAAARTGADEREPRKSQATAGRPWWSQLLRLASR